MLLNTDYGTIPLYGDGLLQVVSMPADDLATHAECSLAMS